MVDDAVTQALATSAARSPQRACFLLHVRPEQLEPYLAAHERVWTDMRQALTDCGWHVQPTYGFGRSPAHIHLTIDPGNAAHADAFARDLAQCLVDLPPRQEAPAEVVAMLQHLATSEGDGEGGMDTGMLMAGMGITDGQLPTRAAMIHRLLDAAPPVVRERLLVLFMGELFT